MNMFREGHRNNDTFKGMSQFAKPLTDQEIAMLADYYACTEQSSLAPQAKR